MVDRIIADTSHPSPGDPAKMVEIMIASVEAEPAPRRIALGSDAYQVMYAQLSARLAALEAQRELACSTDVAAENSATATRWFKADESQPASATTSSQTA